MYAEGRHAAEIFNAAVRIAPGERPAFLEDACRGDGELRAEVESLLETYEGDPGFLEPDGTGPESETNLPPDLGEFAHYHLLEELGRGGQGAVYLARDQKLGRRVALKVLSIPMAMAPEARSRFQREAEAASRLDDPGICAVYEAGEFQGVPYIAMRYVEGQTLAERLTEARESSCNQESTTGLPLPVEERGEDSRGSSSMRDPVRRVLRFFERAARALHVAHEAGLIHRDIKPGNIMVTGEGKPVIVDFGLVRVMEGDDPTLTRTGDLLGTPHYMSPEQITTSRIPLDRTTDVYSLGATLYECLTLKRPFEAATREGLYQRILTSEPRNPRHLNPHISRDLAVVLETALERSGERRYRSALDFAEDLRRVREYEPIRARRAGPALRLRRWTQRNPVAASVFLVITLALVVISWQWIRVRREAARIEQISQFLESILIAPNALRFEVSSRSPRELGSQVLLTDVLDDAVGRWEEEPIPDPQVEATVRYQIGVSYFSVGNIVKSVAQLKRAFELLRHERGSTDSSTLACQTHLALSLTYLGRPIEGERLAREAVDGYHELHGPYHEDTLVAMFNHWNCLIELSRHKEAVSVARAMIDILDTSEEKLKFARFVAMAAHGLTLSGLGDPDEAEARLREARDRVLAATGGNNPWLGLIEFWLGLVAQDQGDPEVAEAQLQRAHKELSRYFPRDSLIALRPKENLAWLRWGQEKFDDALEIWKEVRTAARQLGDPRQEAVAVDGIRVNLFWLNRFEEVEEWRDEWLRIRADAGFEDSHDIAWVLGKIGSELLEKKPDEAQNYLCEALSILRSLPPWDLSWSPRRHISLWMIQLLDERGTALCDEEHFAEALLLFQDIEELRVECKLEQDPKVQLHHADCQLGLGDREAAEEHLIRAYALAEKAEATPDELPAAIARRLVGLYESWGKPAQARKWMPDSP